MTSPTHWPLIVQPRGRFANQMFQLMLATRINERLDGQGTIYGHDLPDWGLLGKALCAPPRRPLRMRGHLFDLDETAYTLRSGLCDAILIEGWGMRMEYLRDPQPFRVMFQSPVLPQPIAEDEILIHVRAEDIETGEYPGYYPLPFAYYDAVILRESRKPVFMGQLQNSPYMLALRQRYPQARFLPVASAACDFQTLRCARHVALSISSFAWLAAWLSDSAESIHYPIAGILDPRGGSQNLLPLGDPRYQYWDVDFPAMSQRPELEAAAWARQARPARACDAPALMRVMADAMTVRMRQAAPVRPIGQSAIC